MVEVKKCNLHIMPLSNKKKKLGCMGSTPSVHQLILTSDKEMQIQYPYIKPASFMRYMTQSM